MAVASNELVQLIDANDNTNLHVLAARGADEELQALHVGAKIDHENFFGWTPLMVAARYGHLQTVKVLLEKRADASRSNKYDASVFLMAVASGNLAIIKFLLEFLLSGGLSRRTIATCISPLALSALFQHEEVLKYILAKRFPVNACTLSTQITPLMFAVLAEDPAMQKHLILHGADSNARNANGETAEDLLHRRLQRNSPFLHSPALQPYESNAVPSPFILINTSTFISPSLCHDGNPLMRRSSNACTPDIPPTLSPLICPQIFFPQDFSSFGYIPTPLSPGNPEYIMSPFVAIASPVAALLNKCISPAHNNMPE